MKYGPRWAAGCYFVPFLNLVAPYQAMKEIWQVSGNPRAWQVQPGSTLLGFWWALWLGNGLFGNIVMRMTASAETIEEYINAGWATLFSNILGVSVAIIAIVMVRTISQRQDALLAGEAPTSSPPLV